MSDTPTFGALLKAITHERFHGDHLAIYRHHLIRCRTSTLPPDAETADKFDRATSP